MNFLFKGLVRDIALKDFLNKDYEDGYMAYSYHLSVKPEY